MDEILRTLKDWLPIIASIIAGLGGIAGLAAWKKVVVDDKNKQKELTIQEKIAEADIAKKLQEASQGISEFWEKRFYDQKCEYEKLKDKLESVIRENEMLKERISFFERALLESPLYRLFFEITQFASIIVDLETGNFFDCNKSFKRTYEYSEYDTVLNIKDIWVDLQECSDFIDKKSLHVVNKLHKTKSGEQFEVEIYAMYTEHKEVPYALCILIPDKKQ
jgi:hypothetical protein